MANEVTPAGGGAAFSHGAHRATAASGSASRASAAAVDQLSSSFGQGLMIGGGSTSEAVPPITVQHELLNEIFRFKHKAPSASQDESTCEVLARYFAQFVTSIKPEEHEELKRVWAILLNADATLKHGDIWVEKWFPKYGCVLLMEMVSVASILLKLVFLDGWERVMHFPPSGDCVHSAVSTKYATINCGTVSPRLKNKLMAALDNEIKNAKPRTGTERSAGFNEIGHQKTPQFIAALIRIAKSSLSGQTIRIPPRIHGGTTDVGLHTGGRSHDTCWLLVQGVIRQNLPGCGILFDKAKLLFKLSVLTSETKTLELLAKSATTLDASCLSMAEDTYAMLQHVVLELIGLARQGYNATVLEARCEELQDRIVNVIKEVNMRGAEYYKLPSSDECEEIAAAMEYPRLAQLQYSNVYEQSVDTSYDVEQHARRQLQFFTFVDPGTCLTASLLVWLAKTNTFSKTKNIALVVLRTIESFLFRKSSFLVDTESDAIDCTPTQLRDLIQVYEQRTKECNAEPLADSLMEVEQRSHELLVRWIAFCLTHQIFSEKYSLLKEYGIALSWRSLDAAVLRERAAVDALSNIAAYIRSCEKRNKDPLFDLNDSAPTARFACAFALRDPTCIKIYAAEVAEWEADLSRKWGIISDKKARAAILRAQIKEISDSIQENQQLLEDEKARLREKNQELPRNRRRWENKTTWEHTNNITMFRDQLYYRQTDLENTLKMPAITVRSLPEDRMCALETLFFLQIPDDIALLCEFCMRAQRALASPDLAPKDAQLLLDDEQKTTWLSHYSRYGVYALPSSASTTAYQTSIIVPNSHGPTSVDSLKDRDDFAKRCSDSHGTPLNPFKITRAMMIDYFSHRMPSEFKHLQWAVAYPGGDQRGNLVYSKLKEQQLDGFDRRSFIVLGSLRAFPNQQIRKICSALKDNVLPWSHPCVGAVIRQAMYHIGELTDEDRPVSLWQSDIHSQDSLSVICAAIDQAANKLDLTPRDFENVPLLSELAAFLSQFTEKAKPLVSRFVKMCRRWASDIKQQCQTNRSMSSAEVTELRAKECLLYGYAIQSCTLGTLDNSTLLELGQLNVLFQNAMLFSTGSKLWSALQRVEIIVCEIMSRRIAAVYSQLRFSNVLTSLARLVNTSASLELSWNHYLQDNEQYETYHSAPGDTHYAINVFTGVILTDGSSPGGLPSQIRVHPQYRRLFQDQDLEVTFSKGVYRTAYSIQGCYFDFSLVNNEVHVRELYYDAKMNVVKTLDTCSLSWIQSLGAVVPARIVQIYSLWYWVEKDCILVRPTSAFDKRAEFIISLDKDSKDCPIVSKCFQVPTADSSLPHATLIDRLEKYDSIVTIDTSLEKNERVGASGERLLRLLRKFEQDHYIHTLRTADGRLKINFPRFRLNFILNWENELASVEYEGYVLDQNQQFEDAFPNFKRYFVLRLTDSTAMAKPKVRIIVPLGKAINASGVIDIEVPKDPSAKLDVTVFDVHRRLQTFSTESITSRLQLCAILASTGSNIPSIYFKMTGSEAALQTLNGCYFSYPFSQRDKDLLRNVCVFGHREPGLKILASSILQKSERCSFLAGGDAGEVRLFEIECADELDEYSATCVQLPERNALRTRLHAVEENLVLGNILQHEMMSKRSTQQLMELNPPLVGKNFVSEIEASLQQFLAFSKDTTAAPPLPLTLLEMDAIGKEMNAELQESWIAYHRHPDKQLLTSPSALAFTCRLSLKAVRAKLLKLEQYLFDAIDSTRRDIFSRLLLLINYLPKLTIADIMRSSIDDDILLQLVPRLSLRARAIFRAATLQYMELCVLEDKLERLLANAELPTPPSPSYFVDELSSVRKWKSEEYPYWLAFEVEGRLQIRDEQYVVAKHLIDKPGAVCQMNMGRGKTRVILPMLFLYFSHRYRERVVRAHFLTPLLSETRQFMHRYLSASSILGLKFVKQPFHRNIDLDVDRLNLIREDLEEAKTRGKFLIVAPEHRMSLELKRLDLKNSGVDGRDEMVEVLEEILAHDQYIDVLDECDAILHHKYHLIYAVGAPEKLEHGETRWLAAQALLRVIATPTTSSRLGKVLRRAHVCFVSPEHADRLGAYNGLRLNASVENKETLRSELKKALVLDLMDDPPFSLVWLKKLADTNRKFRNRLAHALIDPMISLDEAIMSAEASTKISRFRDHLLALRGLVAFGILEHCLERRHRVEYGLPEQGTRGKRMAVPFRAADIPSERSEFSHPEVGIVLTILGYYNTGLTTDELKKHYNSCFCSDSPSKVGFTQRDIMR